MRGFSTNYAPREGENKKKKYLVWRYDLATGDSKLVPVKSICREDYLYEFTGKTGEIVLPNYLEKVFDKLENLFGEYRSRLEGKVFNEANYHTRCFLDKDEKTFWIAHIAIQTLRNPETLSLAERLSKEVSGGQINDRQAHNVALHYCVPFLMAFDEEMPELGALGEIIQSMTDMAFAVCVDEKARFVTSERAVHFEGKFSEEAGRIECRQVLFPITAQICLVLTDKKKELPKNYLVPAQDIVCDEVLYWFSRDGHKAVFANHELTKREISIIRSNTKPVR